MSEGRSLTDRVSAASVKAGAAGASRALARGAVAVTAKLVGRVGWLGSCTPAQARVC
jgi:hypothetical protein